VALSLVKGGLGSLQTLAEEVEAQDIADTIGIAPEQAAEIQAAAKRANGSPGLETARP